MYVDFRMIRRQIWRAAAAAMAVLTLTGPQALGQEPKANYAEPSVYLEEGKSSVRPIAAVSTSTAGFVGAAPDTNARLNEAVLLTNWSDFTRTFASAENFPSTMLAQGVYGFFSNGGSRCYVVNVGQGQAITGKDAGLSLFESVDEISIVAAPGYFDVASHDALIEHCEKLRDRVAILDPPRDVPDLRQLQRVEGGQRDGLRPRNSEGGYAAFYFPWITVRNPFNSKETIAVPPSGHVAGIYARVDSSRGVHKAPANAVVRGAVSVTQTITGQQQAELNPRGVNCIRAFPSEGILVWGARTLSAQNSEFRYVNVRRLVNMVEESIQRSTRWVVFEPNNAALQKAIRTDVGAFLISLWRGGALAGATPEQAFFVKCDAENNPPEQLVNGQVTFDVGIAVIKPAEFIIIRFQQRAAD